MQLICSHLLSTFYRLSAVSSVEKIIPGLHLAPHPSTTQFSPRPHLLLSHGFLGGDAKKRENRKIVQIHIRHLEETYRNSHYQL